MALFFSDASDVSKSKKPGMRMEKCLLGQQELDVPEIMMEDVRFNFFLTFCAAMFIYFQSLLSRHCF